MSRMRVGVPKEIKPSEGRVALTPGGARELIARGHSVVVERGAGVGSRYDDDAYRAVGAELADDEAAWAGDMVLKVKEPLESEFGYLRPGLTLFTYLHLVAAPALTEALIASRTTAIAYETVEDGAGRLPLLAPMSEIAGRIATQAGAHFMLAPMGGPGNLIGGAPGVPPARVLIVGGGAVGVSAARVAVGMGAEVTVLETNPDRIRELELYFETAARVLMSDAATLDEQLAHADLVIGAVLVPGDRAPKLIDAERLAAMPDHSVLVDVAIDQGGCSVASRPTTHEDPVFDASGVLHYCVANMPGAVPSTSTRALTNATLPYVLRLADGGPRRALDEDRGLAAGLNVDDGEVVYDAVAAAREPA